MGGIAKGQIVREIDAMGGYSGIIGHKINLPFNSKMLNLPKGHLQCGLQELKTIEWNLQKNRRLALENTPNAWFFSKMEPNRDYK